MLLRCIAFTDVLCASSPPEWRSELRNVLPTEELLALPQRFAEYTENTDKRLDSAMGVSMVELLPEGSDAQERSPRRHYNTGG